MLISLLHYFRSKVSSHAYITEKGSRNNNNIRLAIRKKIFFEPLPLVEPLYVSRDISSRVTVETRKRKEVISSGKLKVSDVFQGLVFVLKIVGWFLKIY